MEARQLMQATNEDRARQGLGPLKWDPALARAAQKHAQLMVGQSALSHQYAGEAELETRIGLLAVVEPRATCPESRLFAQVDCRSEVCQGIPKPWGVSGE